MALSVLVGTIVGVGMFGIPYAVSKSGLAAGLIYLVVLSVAMVFVHLFFGEIILRTKGDHRMVGYAERYFGGRGKILSTFFVLFDFYGALLAYLIVSGEFLNNIFGGIFGGGPVFYSLIFFIIGGAFIYWGIKLISEGELVMTILLLLTAAIIILKGLSCVRLENFLDIGFINWRDTFLPYGVIWFSLSGMSAIPEVAGMLKNKKTLKKILIVGTLLPAFIYLIFTFVVLGVSGTHVSEEAMGGLGGVLGPEITLIGSIFGFLAVATSFLVIGLNLKTTFIRDYKLNHALSWLLTMAIPLIIFIFGPRSFIGVISLVGALSGSAVGILTILIYKKSKKTGDRETEFSIGRWGAIGNFLFIIFVLAIIYELWRIIA